MSKKDRRIKDLERTLRASVARNAIVARENRELWAAYEAVIVDRDELQRQHDVADRESTNAWVSNIALRNRLADAEGQVDSLAHDLGECQAGREALQRYIDDLAPVAVWKAHAKETAVYADEMKAENAELKERLDNIKFFLSDGDEG